MNARGCLFTILALSAMSCSAEGDKTGVLYLPDMFTSVPYDSHDPNPVLPNGQTLQPMPEGTVARGEAPFHYAAGPQEAARAGRELTNPLRATPANLARGAAVFGTFCFPCHGPQGAGDGPVVPPFPNPPALTADHAKRLPDGQIFHIISRGQGIMPSHATQVRPEDRWKVILHIRRLQGVNPNGQ